MSLNNDKFRDDFFSTITQIVNAITNSNQGNEVAREVAKRYGGQMIYINKNMQDMFDEKHEKIFAEFNGRNIRELAIKYNLSEQHIYRIIQKVKNNQQLSLFD